MQSAYNGSMYQNGGGPGQAMGTPGQEEGNWSPVCCPFCTKHILQPDQVYVHVRQCITLFEEYFTLPCSRCMSVQMVPGPTAEPTTIGAAPAHEQHLFESGHRDRHQQPQQQAQQQQQQQQPQQQQQAQPSRQVQQKEKQRAAQEKRQNDRGQNARGTTASTQPVPRANAASRTTTTTLSQLTDAKFADLTVNEKTKRAMREVLHYERMTKVQKFSIPVAVRGVDVLVKAKTGTGKTLSFLIPTVEAISKIPVATRKGRISAIIISPTRELAQQIEEEGAMLLRFHDMHLFSVVGGVKITKDNSKLRSRVPDILVATPGRLNDHLQNFGMRDLTANMKVLVLDEADRLLDMGFRPELTRIMNQLPKKDTRQTLLFSATMPSDVKEIAQLALKNSYEFIDTVGEEENTHQHIPQMYQVCPLEQLIPQLLHLVTEQCKTEDYKLMVFFPAARLVQFYAALFQKLGFNILEMHSRKSQQHRNRMSEAFRNQKRVIMFTSDVSARGMDYPDVTSVIQVGLPESKAQYIHRLGRTGRAFKGGCGFLVLCDFEKSFLRKLGDLKMSELPLAPPAVTDALEPRIARALNQVDRNVFAMAYQAWIGFYNSNLKTTKWSKAELVQNGNRWICESCRQPAPPAIRARTVGKMGLKNVPGLNIER